MLNRLLFKVSWKNRK